MPKFELDLKIDRDFVLEVMLIIGVFIIAWRVVSCATASGL